MCMRELLAPYLHHPVITLEQTIPTVFTTPIGEWTW